MNAKSSIPSPEELLAEAKDSRILEDYEFLCGHYDSCAYPIFRFIVARHGRSPGAYGRHLQANNTTDAKKISATTAVAAVQQILRGDTRRAYADMEEDSNFATVMRMAAEDLNDPRLKVEDIFGIPLPLGYGEFLPDTPVHPPVAEFLAKEQPITRKHFYELIKMYPYARKEKGCEFLDYFALFVARHSKQPIVSNGAPGAGIRNGSGDVVRHFISDPKIKMNPSDPRLHNMSAAITGIFELAPKNMQATEFLLRQAEVELKLNYAELAVPFAKAHAARIAGRMHIPTRNTSSLKGQSARLKVSRL